MKMRMLLVVLSVLAVAGWTQATRRGQWEYTTETSTFGKPAQLNRLGAEGWELVAVQVNGTEAMYFLKRPK